MTSCFLNLIITVQTSSSFIVMVAFTCRATSLHELLQDFYFMKKCECKRGKCQHCENKNLCLFCTSETSSQTRKTGRCWKARFNSTWSLVRDLWVLSMVWDQFPILCKEHPLLSLRNATILGKQKLENASSGVAVYMTFFGATDYNGRWGCSACYGSRLFFIHKWVSIPQEIAKFSAK